MSRTYRGVTIDRVPGSGLWRAYCPGDACGGWTAYVFADSLSGIKYMIRERIAR